MQKARRTAQGVHDTNVTLVAWYRSLTAIAFFMWVLVLPADLAGQAKPVRRILILNEVGTSYPLINLVESKAHHGTTVFACVPLGSKALWRGLGHPRALARSAFDT